MTSPIKPSLKSEILPVFCLVLAIFFSFYFYARFPERVPIHWDFAGQPNDYGSKAFAAFFFPALISGIYILLLFLPSLDPKKDSYLQFQRAYHRIKNAIILFMVCLYFITGLAGLNHNLRIDFWTPILVGLLFILIGSYMTKLKPNWFIGIRTPWTLSSEIVWEKTHLLGSRLFIASGLLLLFAPALPVVWRPIILGLAVILTALITIIYSYFVYRQVNRQKKP